MRNRFYDLGSVTVKTVKLVLLNAVLSYGSTGKIVDQLGSMSGKYGWDCKVVHGSKYLRPTSLDHIVVGNTIDVLAHEAKSFLFDAHGTASVASTTALIEKLEKYAPDLIHLHNIHGYWLNYPAFFKYLAGLSVPVVWTLHDCWPFTGHCSYFDMVGCDKWKTHCSGCQGLKVYPRSLTDRSSRNWEKKKAAFTSIIDRLTIVPVSNWLEGFVKESFLKEASAHTIHNGIDVHAFCPKETEALRARLGIRNKKVVLGVALPWVPRKGLADMIRLSQELDGSEYQVILVGLSSEQQRQMPDSVIGVPRTGSVTELAEYYSLAEVFVNPTYEDNFPTTNLEALACGTPVITYRTGGSPEAIDESTGIVVDQGDFKGLLSAIKEIDKDSSTASCRSRAIKLFDKENRFEEYFQLYDRLCSRS